MKPTNRSAYLEAFLETGSIPVGIIDTHTHMNDVYGTCMCVYEYEETIRRAKEQGIAGIWCSPHSDLFDGLARNGEITEMMDRYPGYVRGYFGFNPNYAEEYDVEDVLKHEGYIGFKTLPDYYRTPLGDWRYQKLFEIANAYSLALLVHTWGFSRYNDVEDMKKIADRYPDIRLIMGHSAPNRLDDAIALAKEKENVYLDLCDIHRHSGIVAKMVNAVGSEKVLFGTDLPWYDPNYCLGSVLYADVTDADRDNIFYKNSERIIGRIKK